MLIGCVFIHNCEARVIAGMIALVAMISSFAVDLSHDTGNGITIESGFMAASKEATAKTEEIENPNTIVKYGTEEEKILNSQLLFPTKTGDKDVDKKVEEIFSEILDDSMSNYEKVLAVYEYVETNFSYASSYIAPSVSYKSSYDEKVVGRAKGILTTGHGTCTEFNSLFMVMMRALGLDAYCVQGTYGGGSHTWTIIILDDQKYIFDPQIDFRNWQSNRSLQYGHFMMNSSSPRYGSYYAFNEYDNIWSFNNFELA